MVVLNILLFSRFPFWLLSLKVLLDMKGDIVDGRTPAKQSICGLSHVLQGSFIPGCAGFLPSTVSSPSSVCSRNEM